MTLIKFSSRLFIVFNSALLIFYLIIISQSIAYACFNNVTEDCTHVATTTEGNYSVHSNTSKVKQYRINYKNLDKMQESMSPDSFLEAVALGASVWHEQAHSGSFQYIGTTNLESMSSCPPYSLITIVNGISGAGNVFADMGVRCS